MNQNLSILIVDDDRRMTRTLADILKVSGYLATEASSGPDALEKVYKTVKPQTGKLICVLGAAGGGRDTWKRPEFGKIASKFCDEIILTNEDPYDENPEAILDNIASGFSEIRNSNIEIRKISKL